MSVVIVIIVCQCQAFHSSTANDKPDTFHSADESTLCEHVNCEDVFQPGEDIDTRDKKGRTSLMRASMFNQTKRAEDLLCCGAYVNHVDHRGMTALMWASYNGNIELVKLFLNYEADFNMVANDGATAFILTKSPDVQSILVSDGLKPKYQKFSQEIEEEMLESLINRTKVEDFLQGKLCLQGLSTTLYYNYELCFGEKVDRFLLYKDGKKRTFNLGDFDVENHQEYIIQHDHDEDRHIGGEMSFLYSEGDPVSNLEDGQCQTEVTLKCVGEDQFIDIGISIQEPKVKLEIKI